MRFARSRPRLSFADLHIVRAEAEAFRLIVMVRQCRHVLLRANSDLR
jgi:hypothetical protein